MSVEAISWALNLAPVPADRGGQPSSALAAFTDANTDGVRNPHAVLRAPAAVPVLQAGHHSQPRESCHTAGLRPCRFIRATAFTAVTDSERPLILRAGRIRAYRRIRAHSLGAIWRGCRAQIICWRAFSVGSRVGVRDLDARAHRS